MAPTTPYFDDNYSRPPRFQQVVPLKGPYSPYADSYRAYECDK